MIKLMRNNTDTESLFSIDKSEISCFIFCPHPTSEFSNQLE